MSDAEAPFGRRLWVPIAVLAVLGAGAVALTQLARPKPLDPVVRDPFDWVVAAPTPRGDPVAWKGALAPGDEFRGKGTFVYRREASGEFGRAPMSENGNGRGRY